MKICQVEDCDGSAIARGWCNTHYRRWRRAANAETIREQGRRLYASNLEKYRAQGREKRRRSREADPERNRASVRKWRQADPDRANEYQRQWRAANPDKTRELSRRARQRPQTIARKLTYDRLRRASKRQVPFEIFTDQEIFIRDGWKCALCGKPVDSRIKMPNAKAPSLDHIVPLSRDGAHTRANVQLAHVGCNSSKNNRTTLRGEQLRLIG